MCIAGLTSFRRWRQLARPRSWVYLLSASLHHQTTYLWPFLPLRVSSATAGSALPLRQALAVVSLSVAGLALPSSREGTGCQLRAFHLAVRTLLPAREKDTPAGQALKLAPHAGVSLIVAGLKALPGVTFPKDVRGCVSAQVVLQVAALTVPCCQLVSARLVAGRTAGVCTCVSCPDKKKLGPPCRQLRAQGCKTWTHRPNVQRYKHCSGLCVGWPSPRS